MNHPDIANNNAKARHAQLIKTAAMHRRAMGMVGDKPTLQLILRNLIRRWLRTPELHKQVPESAEAGRAA